MQPVTATSAEVSLKLNRARLDDLRRAHDIKSEAELARRIGVNPSTLWRVSSGEVEPSSTFIARVKLAFPMARLDDLFEATKVDTAADEAAAS